MIDPKIKCQVIKTLHSKILSETSCNLDNCKISVDNENITLFAEHDGTEFTHVLGGVEKITIKSMFISKLVKYIKKENPNFKRNDFIILIIDFKKSIIEILSGNTAKNGEEFFYNFQF